MIVVPCVCRQTHCLCSGFALSAAPHYQPGESPSFRRAHDTYDFELVRRRQHPRHQATRRHAPTWRSSRTTCRISTSGSTSASPADAGARSHAAHHQLRRLGLSQRLAGLQRRDELRPRRMVPHRDTSYADGVLTMSFTMPTDVVWVAYFAPYSMERHHDLVTQTAAIDGVEYRSLGKTPRRTGHRLPDDRRRPAQRLALRPPAPGREHGRMVDGRRARKADRRRRSGRSQASQRMHLPRRAEHEPGRLAPRPPAHQRRRRKPQPRMARAVRREEPGSAVRSQRDGRNRRRFRDGHPRRRSDPRQLPCWVRRHSVASPSASRNCSSLFAETLERLSPDFQRSQGYEVPAPGQANMSCPRPSLPSATAASR